MIAGAGVVLALTGGTAASMAVGVILALTGVAVAIYGAMIHPELAVEARALDEVLSSAPWQRALVTVLDAPAPWTVGAVVVLDPERGTVLDSWIDDAPFGARPDADGIPAWADLAVADDGVSAVLRTTGGRHLVHLHRTGTVTGADQIHDWARFEATLNWSFPPDLEIPAGPITPAERRRTARIPGIVTPGLPAANPNDAVPEPAAPATHPSRRPIVAALIAAAALTVVAVVSLLGADRRHTELIETAASGVRSEAVVLDARSAPQPGELVVTVRTVDGREVAAAADDAGHCAADDAGHCAADDAGHCAAGRRVTIADVGAEAVVVDAVPRSQGAGVARLHLIGVGALVAAAALGELRLRYRRFRPTTSSDVHVARRRAQR